MARFRQFLIVKNIFSQEAVIRTMGVEAVKANNFAYTALVTAVFGGYSNVANVLIARTGLSMDSTGVVGNTALMWACYWGQYNVALSLLQQGADYTIVNNDGETALSLAVKQGFRNIATLLLSYGASK